MNSDLLMLAEGITDFLPWYSWLAMGLLVVIIVGYRIYQKKMME